MPVVSEGGATENSWGERGERGRQKRRRRKGAVWVRSIESFEEGWRAIVVER